MNDWHLGNMNLVQSAHITDGYTESKGEQPYPRNEELRVRVSTFFLLVKPSCEHLPQCGPHSAREMWPHSSAASRILGALQRPKLRLTHCFIPQTATELVFSENLAKGLHG